MIRRYPHSGTLVICVEEDSPSGIPKTTEKRFEIIGRFEPAAMKSDNIDYKAKYYCQNFQHLLTKFMAEGVLPSGFIELSDRKDLKPFSVDGQTFVFNDKNFEVILLHNYQTHCEIWLE